MDRTKRDAPQRSEIDAGAVGGGAPGKVTLTSKLGRRGPSAEAVAEQMMAQLGIGSLQRKAADELGTRADASGDQVAFAESPDLVLVAHETAAGVSSLQMAALDDARPQFRSGVDGAADPHAVAAAGMAGGGRQLPYLDRIQASFGRHDVSGVSAHWGGTAELSARALGARAYASGNNVVLGEGGTDLHTVAHEATHVVQQRGGVALKSGIGEVGDRYERHADAVADLVVQGRSAEDLLDVYAGGAGGASAGGAIQALQLATLEGGGATWEVRVDQVAPASGRPPSTNGVIVFSATEGATVSSSDVESGIGLPPGSLAPAEPIRCYDGSAVAAFAPERGQQQGDAPARGGGDVIAQVRAWIAERNQQEAAEADASAAAWAPFTAQFNTEFAAILTELGAGEDGFTSEQLQGMFTERQRELLQQYMTPEHPIPEGLFNGAERGGATAQQRILMSSHMLVHGNYQHRDDAEGREPESGPVHAGSCGNWARLVLDYAGASPDHGAGLPNAGPDYGHLRNEDDTVEGGRDRDALHGGSTAGDAPAGYSSETPEGVSAEDAPRWERRNRRRDAMAGERIPRARLDGLQPGDWIYIFNDQGRGTLSSFGQHSLIFIRWIEQPSERDGYYYGRAMTQDQLSPSQGGQTHEINLGDHYRQTRPRIFPVTNVVRVTEDTGPARPEAEAGGGPPPGD